MNGYLFPDGFAELLIQCVAKTGEWSPDIGFPDCEGRYFILIKKTHWVSTNILITKTENNETLFCKN